MSVPPVHDPGMEKPRIVTAEQWRQERNELLEAEKEATRALDALAARRRRLPMVRFANGSTAPRRGGWTACSSSTTSSTSPRTAARRTGRRLPARLAAAHHLRLTRRSGRSSGGRRPAAASSVSSG
ncbi:DUF899 family protein [Micromonospora sp. RTP1Z1]|uniref:DUF899 family protein n=1 Tax=Micromonospora sp. RTP1Z1 TaxID=2994043 RepID=UPI0029C951C1|nr:DUF899 family protein [Micromonospora sp. RTP1Z1]